MVKNGSGKVIVPYTTYLDNRPLTERDINFLGNMGKQIIPYLRFSAIDDIFSEPYKEERPILIRYPTIKDYNGFISKDFKKYYRIPFSIERTILVSPYKTQDKISGVFCPLELESEFQPIFWGSEEFSLHIYRRNSLVCIHSKREKDKTLRKYKQF